MGISKDYIVLAEYYKEDQLVSYIIQDFKGRVKEIKKNEGRNNNEGYNSK